MRVRAIALLLAAWPSALMADDKTWIRAGEQIVFHATDGRLARPLPVLRPGNTLRFCIEKGEEDRETYLVIGSEERTLAAATANQCERKRAYTIALLIDAPQTEARLAAVVGGAASHLIPGLDGVVPYRLEQAIDLQKDFCDERRTSINEATELLKISRNVYADLASLIARLGGESSILQAGLPADYASVCSGGPTPTWLCAAALRAYVKELSSDLTKLETLGTALASVNAAQPSDVAALTTHTMRLRDIKALSERLVELLVRFQSEGGATACRRRLFSGELLTGPSRDAVAFEEDASFVGRVTADHFRLRNLDHVVLYAQKKGDSQLQYEVKTDAKPAPVSTIKPPGERFTAPVPEMHCKVLSATAPTWVLERASEGAYYPGESVLSFTLQRFGKDLKREDVGTVSIQVAGAYRFAVNTGLYFSSVSTARFLLDAENKVFREERSSVAPGLFVTYNLVPRNYSVSRAFQRGYWIPSPVVGVRLDAPSKEILYGAAIEPVRGVQLMMGGMRAMRSEAAPGVKLGEPLATTGLTTVPTTDKRKSGRYWAVTFDVNLFAKKVIDLVGF